MRKTSTRARENWKHIELDTTGVASQKVYGKGKGIVGERNSNTHSHFYHMPKSGVLQSYWENMIISGKQTKIYAYRENYMRGNKHY